MSRVARLCLLRHAPSTYNQRMSEQANHPLYQQFLAAYTQDWTAAETRDLALQLMKQQGQPELDWQTPLTEQGMQLAKQTGQRLAHSQPLPTVVVLSPYTRVQQTYAHLCQGWDDLSTVSTAVDERVREQEFGLRSLLGDWRTYNVMYPEQKFLYDSQGLYWYRYPQGENIPDVRTRLQAWLNDLGDKYTNKSVLVITHHVAILAIRSLVEDWSAAQFEQVYKSEWPRNCSLTTYIQAKDGYHLESYNQLPAEL